MAAAIPAIERALCSLWLTPTSTGLPHPQGDRRGMGLRALAEDQRAEGLNVTLRRTH